MILIHISTITYWIFFCDHFNLSKEFWSAYFFHKCIVIKDTNNESKKHKLLVFLNKGSLQNIVSTSLEGKNEIHFNRPMYFLSDRVEICVLTGIKHFLRLQFDAAKRLSSKRLEIP